MKKKNVVVVVVEMALKRKSRSKLRKISEKEILVIFLLYTLFISLSLSSIRKQSNKKEIKKKVVEEIFHHGTSRNKKIHF